MILQSLRELALREGLVDDPAFESKPVRWVIELKPDGRFRQLYHTNTPQALPEGSKKNSRLEAKLMVIPRRCIRPGDQAKSNFLVDNAKYVLGIDSAEGNPDPKNIKRHAAYLEQLNRAREAAPSPELDTVLAFLAEDAQRHACRAELDRQGGFADNDLFTFEVEGEMLHQAETLRQYWASLQDEAPESGQHTQCLVCGEQRSPAALHNQIQIRGGSTAGVPLVSFNVNAFEKYGWSGNDNAPVCNECMTAYVESLRRLTRPRYINPRTSERLQPLSTTLNGDTTAVYWADSDDPLIAGLSLVRDDPKKVMDLLASPRQGVHVSVGTPTRFYCLILTGTQGRAIVRRVHTGTVAEVQQNLNRYFAAIDVDRFDRGTPLPQFLLLKSMVLNGELDRLPAELATELWLAALFGLALSRSFLASVMMRNRAERKVSAERAALLHLFFTSHRRSATADIPVPTAPSAGEEIAHPMSLNRESKDPAYLLGRLLAVLENLQTAAQGQNLNRTLVDRTFGAASTRPGVVFPQLLQTAQHHFSKAGKKLGGRTVNLDKQLGEIMDGLEIDGFAATLTLEQQGRFALGYYHQRQSFFRGKADSAAASTAPETADSTAEETAAA